MTGQLPPLDEPRRLSEAQEVLRRVAKRMRRRLGRLVPLDELESLGRLAMLHGMRTHDPDRGTFGSYVGQLVRWAMLDGLRQMRGRTGARARILAALDQATEGHHLAAGDELLNEDEQQASLTDLLLRQTDAIAVGLATVRAEAEIAGPVATPEEQLARAEQERLISAAVDRLPEREQALVRRHYYGDEPFSAVAADLGISKAWASELHAKALTALERALPHLR